MHQGQGHYAIPDNDWARYLVGCWKRNLEYREFGGSFSHIRTTNAVIVIEEVAVPQLGGIAGVSAAAAESAAQSSSGQHGSAGAGGCKFLRWSFGKSLDRDSLKPICLMKVTPNDFSMESFLEWEYRGVRCHGRYTATDAGGVGILNFPMERTSITNTLRVLDADNMAVCVVEVSNRQPSIQYGTMMRLDPALYVDDPTLFAHQAI